MTNCKMKWCFFIIFFYNVCSSVDKYICCSSVNLWLATNEIVGFYKMLMKMTAAIIKINYYFYTFKG